MFNRIFNRKTREPMVAKDYMEVLSDGRSHYKDSKPFCGFRTEDLPCRTIRYTVLQSMGMEFHSLVPPLCISASFRSG